MSDDLDVVRVEHAVGRSESIAKIGMALAKAQAEMEGAAKDSLNPHFKSQYADLASIWNACRGPLSKHEIAVIQLPRAYGQEVTVTTMLVHSSGEWIAEGLTLIAGQATPQAVGSAITYGRRYGLAAMVGIAPEDDDGEAAEGRVHVQHAQPEKKVFASEAQAKRLWAIAKEVGWKEDELKKWLKKEHQIETLAEIPRERYDAICKSVEQGAL